MLGDAFRIFAGAKCVNVGARAISAQILRGHKTAMKTIMVWEGGDDYQSVLEKMSACCDALKEMSEQGLHRHQARPDRFQVGRWW